MSGTIENMAQQPYSYPPPVEGQPAPYYPPPQQGYPPPQGGYAAQPGYVPAAPMTAPVTAGYPAPGAPQAHSQVTVWMTAPQPPPDCPPGLEYLTQIDQLLIKQQVELLEAFTGFEGANKYKVLNSLGQQVYFAAEDTDCCTRQCCGPERPFDIKIMDNFQREVIHLSRPLRCSSCWFPCCLQEVEVQSPPGVAVGYVAQLWSICIPKFAIQNANRETVLQIEGPLCTMSICGDIEFNVLSADGNSQVGKVSKQWSGFAKEAFTDADNFGISFPLDLDVKVKAVILGSAFLIDFMFFEKAQESHSDHHY